MKQSWKIAALAAGVVFLAGCGNKGSDNSGQTGSGSGQEGGIISSIKDAMNLGKTMECTYTIKAEDGNDFVSKSYVNGEKYKSSYEVEGKKTISLFDGKYIYSWTEGEKTGTKMEKDCLKDASKPETEKKTGSDAPLDDKISKEEDFENAMDVKCEPASGVDFTAPEEIAWTDQCQMMKEMMEKLKDVQIPQGDVPEMPSAEELSE